MITESAEHQILDRLMTAVIVLTDDHSIEYMNAAAEELLAVSGEHAIGKNISTCFDVQQGLPSSLDQALHASIMFTKRRARWRLHSQQFVTVDYTVTPGFEGRNSIGEIQPLDRILKISREEAWQSSHETSKNLVRSLAHEVKNPLGGIRGAAQLLERELVSEDLTEYTRIIVDEADRLRNLVDRMLGPRVPPKFVKMNIHHVLERVISLISMEAEGVVTIDRNYDPSIPELYGDTEQLIQAFLNIARNALQALIENQSQMQSYIGLTTRIQRRYTIGGVNYPLVVETKITDNGPGSPADLIEKIFLA